MGEGGGSNLYTVADFVLRLCRIGTAASHTGRVGTDPNTGSDSDTETRGNADPDTGTFA